MADGRETRFPSEVGLAKGAEGPAVEGLQRYLSRFGYIKPWYDAGAYAGILREAPIPEVAVGIFDEATVDALLLYQGFHNLPQTGELDEATVAQMSIPRCGYPDITDISGTDPFVGRVNRWRKTVLYYGFQEFTADLTAQQNRDAITAACRLWSDVTPLTFAQHTFQAADIVVRYVAGDHGDGSDNAFDGTGGVLAHAFPPPGIEDPPSLGGDAHFDEAETWALALPIPATNFDLVMVAAHELGHSIGLEHSTDPNAIMRPSFGASTSQRFLHPDDIDEVQLRYGANPRGVRIIPDELNFGNVRVGEASERRFTIGNKEPNDIMVTLPRSERPWFWTPDRAVISPGRHQEVILQFIPGGTGVVQRTFTFTSNGPGSPHSIRVGARVIPGEPP